MKNCGLYIHIPFCEQKCFYCSFVISVGQEHRMEEYAECLCAEMLNCRRVEIQTIYIGGGTPGFLKSEQLKNIFNSIHQNFSLHPQAEITLEANPQDLDLNKSKIIFDLGINRLSIGAQTFHDDKLRYLGRKHTAQTTLDAFDRARKTGFRNISLDLMYGFPNQTMSELENDVRAITSLGAEHISLYTLTIEHNSRFFTKNLQLPESEIQVAQYEFVKEFMEKNGYEQYEVSNFSKKGFESKHNLNYWRGGNYIGLGIAAHSYVDGKRFWNISRLHEYLQKINAKESVEEGNQQLSNYDQMIDVLLFGLRMNAGVDLESIQQEFSCVFKYNVQQKLIEFEKGGFVFRENNQVRVTDQGRLVLDELCAQLI